MSRYIKREAVCNDCNNRKICIDKSCCPVGRAIAVDVVEHKRGYWMDTREFCGDYMCSNCDALYGTNKFNFCPNCGADMRPKEGDA